MPELAEVDFFRRQWDPGIGHRVVAVEAHPWARVFRGCRVEDMQEALTGAVLHHSFAHGKQMIFGLSGGHWLGLHLGMTGELRTQPAATPTGRHDHLVLHLARQSLVFADSRMFGRVRFDHSPGRPPDWWRALPPALLSPQFTAARLGAALALRPRSPLKSLLLDQGIFPGIGNWMADELLWRLHLHPRTAVGTLTPAQIRDVHREVRWLSRRALATIGLDWREPPDTWLYRHRWAAGTCCPRKCCQTPLVRAEAAGRTSCWCPSCQPDPDPPSSRRSDHLVGTGRRREAPHRHPG